MEAYVGTSGWSYPAWSGPFYPPRLPRSQWLAHYCRHFPAVELNASFYRFPNEASIAAWNRALPEGFHLAVKGHRRITHLQRLQGFKETLAAFAERIARIRQARVVLWQFPPSWRRTEPNVALLDAFLSALDGPWHHAVEFRHASWWEQGTEQLLRRHGATFVAVSHPRLPSDLCITSDTIYLRFHGLGARLYDYDYGERELRSWAERVAACAGGRRLYAFFNNTARPAALDNARRFATLLAEAGLRVVRPPTAAQGGATR